LLELRSQQSDFPFDLMLNIIENKDCIKVVENY